MAISISSTRTHGTTVERASPFTDPATPLNVQPAGLTGYGDPVVSEEFGGSVTVTDAGLGYVTLRSGGPTWATWYPNWPRFNTQSPGGNHTNTNQAAYYANSKVAITGGTLRLTCDKQATGGLPYTAGMIQSLPFYTPAAGFFEARLRASSIVSGMWPAWWMSASDFDEWPPEIDIWEYYGEATTYLSNVYRNGGTTDVHYFTASGRVQTDWHTYGCYWGGGGSPVRFYADGALVYTSVQTTNPGEPQYLVLNSGAVDTANPTFDTYALEVDYVRCWNLP